MNYFKKSTLIQRRWLLAACALAVLLGAAMVLILYRQRREERARFRVALAVGQYWARDTAEKVAGQLAALQPLADALVAELESGRLKPGDLPARLVPMLAQAPPGAVRIGVLFRPFAAGPGTRLYSPCAARDGGLRSLRRDEPGDYTLQPWFKLDPAKGTWGEPHRLAGETAPLVDYLRPFRLPGAAEASGLVRLEVPLEHFHGMLRDIGLGFSGYPFLLSARTAFLAFPNPESIAAGKTLADLAKETGNPRLLELARRALEGRSGHAESTSVLTGQKTLTFLEPVPSAHWSVGIDLFREDLGLVPENHRKVALLLITLAVALAWVLYLEWYYFAMYCAILLVSIEALLFARTEHWLWSRDNALARLWFWPALLSGFYVITALYLI